MIRRWIQLFYSDGTILYNELRTGRTSFMKDCFLLLTRKFMRIEMSINSDNFCDISIRYSDEAVEWHFHWRRGLDHSHHTIIKAAIDTHWLNVTMKFRTDNFGTQNHVHLFPRLNEGAFGGFHIQTHNHKHHSLHLIIQTTTAIQNMVC